MNLNTYYLYWDVDEKLIIVFIDINTPKKQGKGSKKKPTASV